MVVDKIIYFFIVFVAQEALSKPQEAQEGTHIGSQYSQYPTSPYEYTFNGYGLYDYGNIDYVNQHDDYAKGGDYGSQVTDYPPQYGDYGGDYGDYGPNFGEDYDHAAYDDYYSNGDRDNPMDTMISVYDETANVGEVPWVFIVVPVIQVDVFYIEEDNGGLEDVEFQLPVQTYFFELGDFGFGHFDLSNYGLEYSGDPDLEYAEDEEYVNFPEYDAKMDMYDTADELEEHINEYPGMDHEGYWVDWIFMLPPDEVIG